ncbi:Vacuolar cation/proton exchanger 1a [Platanthera guangdongensis]|uniref:Vacuolar cation/proton exchanger 1a n=1 Tax=Platanthera guangdongensis TaxID=2320717 RepID=A0ABR2MPG2_9ASPA
MCKNPVLGIRRRNSDRFRRRFGAIGLLALTGKKLGQCNRTVVVDGEEDFARRRRRGRRCRRYQPRPGKNPIVASGKRGLALDIRIPDIPGKLKTGRTSAGGCRPRTPAVVSIRYVGGINTSIPLSSRIAKDQKCCSATIITIPQECNNVKESLNDKVKRNKGCPSMLIDEFVEVHGVSHESGNLHVPHSKEKRDPTQDEIFIETQKGNKRKELYLETNNAIHIITNNEETNAGAFQAVFGEEHSGSMRCFGKGVSKTSLKQKEEIAALIKIHNEEVLELNEKIYNMEYSLNKVKDVLKTMLQQSNPAGIDIESLDDMLGSPPGDANSAQKIVGVSRAHSSTSTHVPNYGEAPLSIFVAWIMGIQMDLDFQLLETDVLVMSILLVAFILQILYNDDDIEVLLLKKERWEPAKVETQTDVVQEKNTPDIIAAKPTTFQLYLASSQMWSWMEARQNISSRIEQHECCGGWNHGEPWPLGHNSLQRAPYKALLLSSAVHNNNPEHNFSLHKKSETCRGRPLHFKGRLVVGGYHISIHYNLRAPLS